MIFRSQPIHWLPLLALSLACTGTLSVPELLANPDGGVGKVDQPVDAGPVVERLTTTGSPRFGINVDPALDYWNNRMFADTIKENRGWVKLNTSNPASIDSLGWPTEDSYVVVYAGLPRADGTYALSFTGQATLSIECCTGTISAVAYDASSNTTTAKVKMPTGDPNSSTLFLNFEHTKRTPGSATNTGVTNVKLMRPLTQGSTSSYTTDVTFTSHFKSALAPFSVLRFMDYLATNNNNDVKWSDRVDITYSSMEIYKDANSPWEGEGGAFGYAFQLCNETAKDCWINIPNRANDDYIKQVAMLAKSMLNPGLHLYVEYSNEVWNTGFRQADDTRQEAIREIDAGVHFPDGGLNPHAGLQDLDFDGDENNYDWIGRNYTKHAVGMSLIFRQVFGDADMMTRVRPVFESQLGYADGPLLEQVRMLQDYYNNPAEVSDPHPANYFFYGGGGSAYYSPAQDKKGSKTDILNSMDLNADWKAAVQSDTVYLRVLGLKHVAYEGGPGLDKVDPNTVPDGGLINANSLAAHDDPQMSQVMTDNQKAWEQNGGDLLVYYQITGDYEWSFMDDVFDQDVGPSNYKYVAVKDMASLPAEANTYGKNVIPATIAASTYEVPPQWALYPQYQMPSEMIGGTWYGYTLLAGSSGTYKFTLKAGCDDGGGRAELWVDGNFVATLTVGGTLNAPTNTAVTSVPLTAGTHGFYIRGAKGTSKVNLDSILVTQ